MTPSSNTHTWEKTCRACSARPTAAHILPGQTGMPVGGFRIRRRSLGWGTDACERIAERWGLAESRLTALDPRSAEADQSGAQLLAASDRQRALARLCSKRRNIGARHRFGAGRPGTVILVSFPRIAPCRPICRIGRATVQRAPGIPSRPGWRQTFRTPWTPTFSAWPHRTSARHAASHRARAELRAGSARRAAWAW